VHIASGKHRRSNFCGRCRDGWALS
jgi:hypothetical protein